jgi:glycine hydroxymethyltransferase
MIYTKIENILKKEKNRQKNTFELIASENFASKAVRKLCGSVFTNKYAEGYPGKRYYNGCLHMDEIEQLAIDNLKKLYSSEFANVQPHCGANANTAVYQAFLTPGDTILGMDLASGGHLSHGAKVNISGKIFNSVHYGVDKNGWLDYNQIATLAQLHKPKMIIAGASAYPRKIDWKTIKDICKQHDCLFMVDIAHYSGLIAGKVYPSPVEYADVVTSTTHKTLRGPRGGFILWNNPDYSKKINSAVFPGTQGGPLMNIIAAKAQAFMEANTRDFQWYSRNVISNAEAMAEVFTSNGFQVQTGGTDSHILLLNLSDKKYSGKEAADILEENGIPNDPRSFVETSGIRIGTAAETTRGHKQNDFKKIAKDICNILS